MTQFGPTLSARILTVSVVSCALACALYIAKATEAFGKTRFSVTDVTKALQESNPLVRIEELERIFRNSEGSIKSLSGQMLATTYSAYGDYDSAIRIYPIPVAKISKDDASCADMPSFEGAPAAEVVSELAARRQIVMVNEAHHVAETRWLSLELLPKLWKEGFRYLAVETLDDGDSKLAERGYATKRTGFYTEEPIYAELIRRAIRLGFVLVSYDLGPFHGEAERETNQAKNIYEKVFRRNPKARIFIHAGYEHIAKRDDMGRNGSLAVRLERLTGIEPLTIDQTTLLPDEPSRQHPCYLPMIRKYRPSVPMALVRRDNGQPWSLRPDHFDLTVLLPRPIEELGRPSWLSLDQSRRVVPISGAMCAQNLPCLVEARLKTDEADSIPSDRYILREEDERSQLYLVPGSYVLTVTGHDGKAIGHGTSILVQ